MERIKKLFHKEFSKISEAALVLGFFTLFSQVLGIVRDRMLAGNIGAGSNLDIYYAAFRVPDLLFTLGASLVSVSILMPFFKSRYDYSKEAGHQFLHDIFTVFFIFIVLASLITAILMPYLAEHLFPGFNPQELKDTIILARIMLLSPILLGVSNLFATITQAFKQFFVYALAPVFYNLGIIVGIVWLYPMFGIAGLGYGVVFGAFLHMAIQIPIVLRHGLLPRLQWRVHWEHIQTVIAHSLPRTITLSMSKIVFLIFVSIASTLVTGTISVFNLSYNLQSVPLAIIGVSYSVAAFPILVDFFNTNDHRKFMNHVMGPIKQILFWSLPVVALFVILRAQIVRVILGTGNFDWSDTRLTAASLALFIVSVVAQSIILLLVRAYYASGKTWKPLWITLVSSVTTILLAYIFINVYNTFPVVKFFFESLLRIEGVRGSSVIMLSLAYSVGMFLNLILLWFAFRRDFEECHGYRLKRAFFQSFSVSLAMAGIAYLMLQLLDPYFSQERTLDVFFHGFISGITALVAGGIILYRIKNQEMFIVSETIRKKLFGSKELPQSETESPVS